MNGSANMWAITPEERDKHDQKFDTLSPSMGYVSGEQTRKFFLQSGLPASVLAEIWALADMNKDGKMDRLEFSIAMKLIKLKLQGTSLPVMLPVIMKQPPVPTPSLSNHSPAYGNTPVSNMSMMTPIAIASPGLSPLTPMTGLTPVVAMGTGLSPLIGSSPSRTFMPLMGNPAQPNGTMGILQPITAGALGASGLPLSPYSSPLLTSAPALNKASSLLDLGTASSSSPSPMSPMVSGPSDWAVPHTSRLKYRQQFNSMDKQMTGYLTGQQVRGAMATTMLTQAQLASIWTLADVDKDGKLKADEFILAMHLVDVAKCGQTLPLTLPAELVPPSQRAAPNGSSSALSAAGSDDLEMELPQKTKTNITFEDKFKANLQRGNAELEKRRVALLEAERREQERRAQKAKELQERREREAREVEERRRKEEERRLERQRELERQKEEERQREMERKERELERQRKEEWERRRGELQSKKEQEQDDISRLKAKKRSLEMELEAVGNKHRQISDRLRDFQNKKKLQRTELDLINQRKDTRQKDITILQKQLEEFQRKLSQLTPEQKRLTERLKLMTVNNTSGSSVTSLKINVSEKTGTCIKLKEQLQTLEKETAAKLSELDQSNQGVQELRENQRKQQAALEKLRSIKEEKRRELTRKKEQKEEQRKEEEEAQRRVKMEKERQWQEKVKREEEEHQRRLQEEREAKQREEEEKERQALLRAEAERRRREEEERKKREEEERHRQAEKQRQEEERRQLEEERRQLEEERRKLEEERKEAKRRKDDEDRQKREQERKRIEEERRRERDEEERRRQKEEEERRRQKEEEERRRQRAAEAAIRDAEERRKREEEEKKKRVEEEEKKKREEEEKKKKEEERRKLQQQEEERRKQEEERKRSEEEMASRQQQQGGVGKLDIQERLNALLRGLEERKGGQPRAAHHRKSAALTSFKALYPFTARNEEELSFNTDDIIEVDESTEREEGWLYGSRQGNMGWFPESYVERAAAVPPPLQSQLSNVLEAAKAAGTKSAFTPTHAPNTVPSNSQGQQQGKVVNLLAQALCSWTAKTENHLNFNKDDVIQVLEQQENWWLGELNGEQGWFPKTYVSLLGEEEPPDMKSCSPADASECDSQQLEEYLALYTYESPEPVDLTFSEGDVILVSKREGEWWSGSIGDRSGVFPSNYVRVKEAETSSTSGKKKPEIAKVIRARSSTSPDQLSLEIGQLILILGKNVCGWWLGELQARGKKRQKGWFPASHVTILGSNSGKSTPAPQPVCQVIAIYDYTAANGDEMSFSKGQLINVLEKNDPDWWKGEINGVTGLFPTNYIKMTTAECDPSQQWW